MASSWRSNSSWRAVWTSGIPKAFSASFSYKSSIRLWCLGTSDIFRVIRLIETIKNDWNLECLGCLIWDDWEDQDSVDPNTNTPTILGLMFWARLSPAKTIRANLNHLWLGGLNDYPHRWHQCDFWICWEIESPNMRFVRSISEWEPQKSNTPAFYKSEYSSYQPGFLENILDILGFNSTDPLNFGAPKLFQDAVPGAPCIPDVAGSSARDRNLDIHSFMRNWRFHHLFFLNMYYSGMTWPVYPPCLPKYHPIFVLPDHFRAIVWTFPTHTRIHRAPSMHRTANSLACSLTKSSTSSWNTPDGRCRWMGVVFYWTMVIAPSLNGIPNIMGILNRIWKLGDGHPPSRHQTCDHGTCDQEKNGQPWPAIYQSSPCTVCTKNDLNKIVTVCKCGAM